MSLSNQKAKDAAMAAYLKARGVRRTGCACSICHRVVSLDSYEHHLLTCKGR